MTDDEVARLLERFSTAEEMADFKVLNFDLIGDAGERAPVVDLLLATHVLAPPAYSVSRIRLRRVQAETLLRELKDAVQFLQIEHGAGPAH